MTNFSTHYDAEHVTSTGQYAIISNIHTQHALEDGYDGNFMYRLM